MSRRKAWITCSVFVALVAGCGDTGTSGAKAPPKPTATTFRSVELAPLPSPELNAPAPEAEIPTDAAKLADSLVQTTAALEVAIDGWLADDEEARGAAPEPVVLLALHQQRVYRLLGRKSELARRTIALLPRELAGQAKDNVSAARDLFSLTRPTRNPGRFRTQDPLPAGELRGYMRQAERRFGVDWEVLAAVMHVETKFGRLRSPSSAGAQGPMQFMPLTWKAFGMDGDVHDAKDAILGAANYLRASGAPRDYGKALFAYNHDRRYVAAVQAYARQIKRDPRNYYAYYNWQVFVLTTRGDLRITGP